MIPYIFPKHSLAQFVKQISLSPEREIKPLFDSFILILKSNWPLLIKALLVLNKVRNERVIHKGPLWAYADPHVGLPSLCSSIFNLLCEVDRQFSKIVFNYYS